MAQKTVLTWRKATKEELLNGSSEMILVEEETINVPDDNDEEDVVRLKKSDIAKLKNLLKSK